MSLRDKIAKIASAKNFEKASKFASAPQRFAMDKLASAVGVRGDAEDSEKSAQAIVEKAAETLGVPEDSVAGNVAKAAAVAGLEVFGDPLGMVPFGKVAKAAKFIRPVEKEAQIAAALAKRAKSIPGMDEFRKLQQEAAKLPKAEKNIKDIARKSEIDRTMDILRKEKWNPAKDIAEQNPEKIIKVPANKIIKSR